MQKERESKLKEICSICRRAKHVLRKGSLTAWIFGASACTCDEKTGSVYSSTPEQPELIVFPSLGEQFEVLSLVGRGGSGTVYKIRDRKLGTVLAAKLLRPEVSNDASALKRLQIELATVRELTHPHIVCIHELRYTTDGVAFLLMDFIDGRNLGDIIADEIYLDSQRAITIFLQVCEGIAAAHAKGIIHLDIKPSNILICCADGIEIAKISDFGLSRQLSAEEDVTQSEEIIGSVPYMSPEQCKGEYKDFRSDIYSLGCLMFETLTGKPPFPGDNPVQVMMKHVQDNRQMLSRSLRRLDIAAPLVKVIRHCVERSPQMRYQLIDELYKDLLSIEDGKDPLIVAQQSSSEKPFWQLSRNINLAIGLFTGSIGTWTLIHLSDYDSFAQIGYFLLGIVMLSYVSFALYLAAVLLKLAERLALYDKNPLNLVCSRITFYAAMPGLFLVVALRLLLDFANFVGIVSFNVEMVCRQPEVAAMVFIGCLAIFLVILARIRKDEEESNYRNFIEREKADDRLKLITDSKNETFHSAT